MQTTAKYLEIAQALRARALLPQLEGQREAMGAMADQLEHLADARTGDAAAVKAASAGLRLLDLFAPLPPGHA